MLAIQHQHSGFLQGLRGIWTEPDRVSFKRRAIVGGQWNSELNPIWVFNLVDLNRGMADDYLWHEQEDFETGEKA